MCALESACPTKKESFEFSKYTTYGIGGKARIAYFPKNIIQACSAYDELKRLNMSYAIIGNGSNLLVSDKGYEGGVICTRNLKGIIRVADDKVMCLAGTTVGELLRYCKNKSLSGLEYLYGIPATLGGAVYMNAGVGGFAFGDNVVSVKIYDGKVRVLSRENCNFAYRHSTMRDINALILSIIVNVNKISLKEIDNRVSYFKERRRHLPTGRSCGCVFKNPSGTSAGYLIEQAGLKGFTVGGATVSNKHASFIINNSGTAEEVKQVIEVVKRKVLERFGILLEEEVVYIGDFNEFNG